MISFRLIIQYWQRYGFGWVQFRLCRKRNTLFQLRFKLVQIFSTSLNHSQKLRKLISLNIHLFKNETTDRKCCCVKTELTMRMDPVTLDLIVWILLAKLSSCTLNSTGIKCESINSTNLSVELNPSQVPAAARAGEVNQRQFAPSLDRFLETGECRIYAQSYSIFH